MVRQEHSAVFRKTLRIYIVFLLSIVPGHTLPVANIALNKPATQSSTYIPSAHDRCPECIGSAWKAVDGILDAVYGHHFCSHTAVFDIPAWWQVDLGSRYLITDVAILNRLGLPERLKDFEIEVSLRNSTSENGQLTEGVSCFRHTGEHPPGGVLTNMTCVEPRVGRFLRISQQTPMLTLCEVLVTGREVVENPHETAGDQQNTTEASPSTGLPQTTSNASLAQSTEPFTTRVATTKAARSNISNTTCPPCQCHFSNASLKYMNKSMDYLIQELRQTLAVSKNATSSFKRKFVSASDDRPSAHYIGYVGVTLLVLSIMTIVVPDLITLVSYLRLQFLRKTD